MIKQNYASLANPHPPSNLPLEGGGIYFSLASGRGEFSDFGDPILRLVLIHSYKDS